MRELPSGTVTFLLTDIEGSTRLLRENRSAYGEILAEHARILRAAFAEHGGREIDTQGDSFFAAFRTGRDAVEAAIAAQRGLAGHPWPGGAEPKVRMGMHTGEPTVAGERYVGLAVHRAARVCAAANGGQVLLSSTTADLVADELPAGVRLADLGDHSLKDFDRPERIFQLVVDGLRADFPPPRTSQPSGLPAAVSRPEPGAGRPVPRGWLVWLAAGLGLLVLVALFLAVAAVRGRGEAGLAPSRSIALIDVATNRVVDSIPLEASPSSVVELDGAIWAALPADRALARIDPESRRVTRRFGLGIAPYSLAPGTNVLWVAGGLDSTILRFVPATEVAGELPGFNAPADGYPVLAATDDALWFGENDDVGVERFDVERGRIVRAGGSLTPEAIAANAAGVWVVERFDQRVVRLDPMTGAQTGEIPFGAPIPPPAAGTLHEPFSQAVLDEHALWISDSIEGKVWRIRPLEGSIQATIRVGDGARTIASGGDSIWVANRADGTVSRIDPRSDSVVATIDVGDRVSGIAVVRGSVWVAVP